MLIKSVFCGLLVAAVWIAAMGSVQVGQDEPTPKEITGESYWYNMGFERVLSSHETEQYIVGVIQARHGLSRFRVRKDQARNPEVKTRGLKMVVEELLAWLNTTSRTFAQTKLQAMTGEQFTDATDWKRWYQANAPYLVWSETQNHLIIDDEAKRGGVPTEIFRKDHPWKEHP